MFTPKSLFDLKKIQNERKGAVTTDIRRKVYTTNTGDLPRPQE